MINAITDFVQSVAILIWAVSMILLALRVNRLNTRLNLNSIAVQQAREMQDPEPICGCGHHQCFHDETGCNKKDANFRFNSSETTYVPCGCKRYTGPESLPTVIP